MARPREWRDTLAFEWHNGDGSVVGVNGVGVANRRFTASDGRMRIHPFSPRFAVAAFQDVVAVGSGEFAEIRLLGHTGDVVRIIRWHAPDPHLTDSEFRRFEKEMIDAAFREDDRPRYRRYLAEAPVARQFPHYVALLWDELDVERVRLYGLMR